MLLISVAAGGCSACDVIRGHTLVASSNPSAAGEEVRFRADWYLTGRAMTSHRLEVSVFDLDGDGEFETSAGTNVAEASRSYPDPATLRVSHLAVANVRSPLSGDPLTDESVATETLVIAPERDENQPPLAAFTAAPNPASVEEEIVLDATGSSDPDGRVVRFEWDLDGDRTFERDTESNPMTRTSFLVVGDHEVGLRVTDDGGVTAATTRTIVVQDPSVTRSLERVGSRLRTADAHEISFAGREISTGRFLLNGDELIATGAKARGRISADIFPPALRHKDRRVRAAASFDVTSDIDSGDASAQGVALLRFPAGGRACLGFQVDAPAGGDPSGVYRVAGGSPGTAGAADRLRGAGAARAGLKGSRVRVTAEPNFRLGKAREYRLGRSRCGPLRRFVSAGG